MNQMEIFKNPEFGTIRAVEIDGEPWLVGKDVALAPVSYTHLDVYKRQRLTNARGRENFNLEGIPVKTYMAKAETVQRKWYVVDAEGMVLGRLASQVAAILRGKNKPTFTPHVDTGDHVIVLNADKVVLTGDKLNQKFYRRHSGYPGGLKETSYKDLMAKKADLAVIEAVRGMLPKNALGRQMIKKLRVYKGAEHDHAAQKPEVLELTK